MKVFSIIKYTCILNYKIKRKSLIYTKIIQYSILNGIGQQAQPI